MFDTRGFVTYIQIEMGQTETVFRVETDKIIGSLVEEAAGILRETRYCEDKSTPYHPWQACRDLVEKIMYERGVDPYVISRAIGAETKFRPTDSNVFFVQLNDRVKKGEAVSWWELQVCFATGAILVELEDRYPQLVNEKQQIYDEHIAWREREERLRRILTGK